MGRKAVSRPMAGRKAQSWYTVVMLVASARRPRRAAPMPATPKARPKKRPEIAPTRPGTSSWAYTRIAEKAEAITRPMITVRISVQNRFAKGSASVSLSPENSSTKLSYSVKANVGGKLAQIGSRLVDGAARKVADDFFRNFNEKLT